MEKRNTSVSINTRLPRLCGFITLILCSAFPSANAIGSNIKIKLTLEKPVYLLREPIFWSLVIKNTGNKEILIDPQTVFASGRKIGDFYGLKLKRKGGKAYDYFLNIDRSTIKEPDYKGKFLPGEERVFLYPLDLLHIYGEPETMERGYLPAGEYEIWWDILVYDSEVHTRISSDKVYFKVIEPVGREKEAYNSYIKARDLDNQGKYKDAYAAYRRFSDNYPWSVYTPFVESKAIWLIEFHNLHGFDFTKKVTPEESAAREKVAQQDYLLAVQECKKIIQKYPLSGYAVDVLKRLVVELVNAGKNKGEIEAEMN